MVPVRCKKRCPTFVSGSVADPPGIEKGRRASFEIARQCRREAFRVGQCSVKRGDRSVPSRHLAGGLAPPIPSRARDAFREPVISQVEFLLSTRSGSSAQSSR